LRIFEKENIEIAVATIQDKTRQGRFYNTHIEISLVLPSFDVVPFDVDDVDKFVDFPEFCCFISAKHCF